MPSKWKLIAILSLSFAVPFFVVIHSTLDVFLHNPTAFLVSWRFLLPTLLIIFAVSVVGVFIFLLLCHKKAVFGIAMLLLLGIAIVLARFVLNMFLEVYILLLIAIGIAMLSWLLLTKIFKNKAPDVILLGIWGVFISSYVQVLFLNNQMIAIAGAYEEHSMLSFRNILNIIIWITIALAPLIIWIVFKIRKREFKYEKVLVFSVLIAACMQAAGLVTAAASTELPKGVDEDFPVYLSFDPTLHLSDENNIIVFIVDALDVRLLRMAFDEYPHIRDALYGFTHFENNVAEFIDTFPSTTVMMTQHHYREGQTISEYWTEAWQQRSVIDVLRENGYTVNLLIDSQTTYGSILELKGRADNLRDVDEVNLSGIGVLGVSMRLSLGRLSPNLLKNIFLGTLDSAFGNQLYTIATDDPTAVQFPIVSLNGDQHFLNFIMHNEFSSDNENKVLTIVHMNGAHGVGYNTAGINHSFGVISYYLRSMEDVGVFDNSTIIILGDHGLRMGSDYGSGRGAPVTTSLLIKPVGGTGELIIDSETELSHSFLPASIIELAGLPHYEFGLSFFDIIYGRYLPPTRILYASYPWWHVWVEDGTSGMLPFLGHYEIIGDANNADNWTFFPRTG